MEAILKAKAPEERFNNLCKGDTLDGFEWFTITAARRDEDEGIIVQCEIGWVEFWSIYGWQTVEDNKGSHQVATPIHDEFDVRDAVRIAAQIARETGKGFMAGDAYYGLFPRRGTSSVPTTDLQDIAEDLTNQIHEDIDSTIDEEDRRDTDFDEHSLADLREAFVDYSDYAGADQLDPYKPEEQTA